MVAADRANVKQASQRSLQPELIFLSCLNGWSGWLSRSFVQRARALAAGFVACAVLPLLCVGRAAWQLGAVCGGSTGFAGWSARGSEPGQVCSGGFRVDH